MRRLVTWGAFLIVLFMAPDTPLFAGAWTLKRGDLWVKTSFLYQKTTERFFSRITPCPIEEGGNCSEGQRVKFPFDGESEVKAVFLDLNYGLLNNLQLDVQIPFYDISFTDLADPDRPSTSEIGDLRFGAKYQVVSRPLVATLKLEAKAPTGFFNRDAEIVPIGDGQWDFDVVAQFGKSVWPIPAYVNFDLGYRFRFEPDVKTSTRNPGNEIVFRGEAGYNVLSSLLVKAAVSGLYGNKFKQEGLIIQDSQREVLLFEPGVVWNLWGGLALDAGLQLSLSGKNYTAGETFNFGLSYQVSLLP